LAPQGVVSTTPSGAWIEVAIDDSGPGIDPAARDRVFEPFYSTKSRAGGTGLGLSISHEIVRRHGGELAIEDRPDGQGCRFVVRLRPARRSAA
jgi:signal transduction histidine kinase